MDIDDFKKIMNEGNFDLLEGVGGAKKIRLAFALDKTTPKQLAYFRILFNIQDLDWSEPDVEDLLKVLEPAIKRRINTRGKIVFTLVEDGDDALLFGERWEREW